MRRRTADQILRDLVETGALTNGALGNEARDYIAAQDAAALALKRREREDEAARKRRTEQARKRLGKLEIAPASEGGIDHSAKGIVLLRKGNHRLVWRSGSKYWSARAVKYAPAELEILERVDHGTLAEGGDYSLRGYSNKSTVLTEHHRRQLLGEKVGVARLSPALIFAHHEAIDRVFGDGAWKRAADAYLSRETAVL